MIKKNLPALQNSHVPEVFFPKIIILNIVCDIIKIINLIVDHENKIEEEEIKIIQAQINLN